MDPTPTAGDSGAGVLPSQGGSPTAPATSVPSSPGAIASAGVSADPTVKGPVPYERFEEVNSKYNTLKWAEAHDPSRVQQQKQFFDWLDADPEGAFRYMEDYLSRSGVLRAKQPQGQNGNGHERPQPDVVVPETGQRFYSAEQAEKLSSWIAQQTVQPLAERLQSFEVDRETARAHSEAARQLAEADTWPHYKVHEATILKEMERDHRLSLEGAYNRVVLPKLRTLEREAVLAEIQQKSQASTTNPGGTTASATKPLTTKSSWADLMRAEVAKRGGI